MPDATIMDTVHQVFISYKEADKALAQDLSLGLEAAGFVTWYYGRDTRVGFNYMEYVGELIAECRAMVLLISAHSVASAQPGGGDRPDLD
jgi:hypothetical protein